MKVQSNQILDEQTNYYERQKRFWGIFAPFYDTIVKPLSGTRTKVVNFTGAKTGSKILDVATGTGKQAFAFAQRNYNVIGIDLSEAMLRIAKKKNKYGNVKFQTADATSLPFANKSFDVSTISFALHEMPLTIREKVLMEMVRVTKPEGTIMIVDFTLPENRIGRFLIYHFVLLFEGEHYARFIKDDLDTSLAKTGIKIQEQLPIVLRGARIIKGTITAR